MISLFVTQIPLTTGQTLLTGLSVWIDIIKPLQNILKKSVFLILTLTVRTQKTKKELKASKEYALFYTVAQRINTLKKLKVFCKKSLTL